MNFRLWLEGVIDRDQARAIVLDAIGASPSDRNEQGDVLGALIRYYPDLEDKLFSYSVLRPYQSQVSGFVRTSGNKTIQDLIDYIDKLDNPGQSAAPQHHIAKKAPYHHARHGDKELNQLTQDDQDLS